MATTTALLKSAASARSKQQAYEDSVAAYEWENSAKTAEDWDWYQKYLSDRGQRATDPSDGLSIQRKLRSAENQYVSQEIERASIDVLEGRATNQEKYGKMVELFYRAVDRGNYDLAQNLRYRLDSLSITIQNEQEKAQGVARTMANNQVKDLKSLIKAMEKGIQNEDGTISGVELGDGTIVRPLSVIENDIRTNGDSYGTLWADARDTVMAIQQVVADTYNSLGDQEAVDRMENDSRLRPILEGEATFKIGGKSLSMQDIDLAYRSALANNPLYSPIVSRDPTTGAQTFSLQKNKTDDFIWAVTDDGMYEAIEVQSKNISPTQTLDTQITGEGSIVGLADANGNANINLGTGQVRPNDDMTIKNRLAAAGIIAEAGDDGKIKLTLPDGSVYSDAVIMPDGSVRYFGQPGEYSGGQSGLYQIDTLSGNIREVSPDETSDFGIGSKFGGQLSKTTAAGKNYIKNLVGLNPATRRLPLTAPISVTNDFSGNGAPVTSNLLQGAALTRQAVEAEERARQEIAQRALQAQEQAQRNLQSGRVPNLNQTPVRQFAANGQPVKQLTVTAPAPTPRITVAAPKPTAPLKVTAPAPTPTLRVR